MRFSIERPFAAGGPALLFDAAAAPEDGDAWLGPDERSRAAAMRFEKRRRDFRAGRWTLHRLLARELLGEHEPSNVVLARFDVRAAPGGAPVAYLDGAPAPCVVSLSHREGGVLAAVAAPGARLGCDLEVDERRSRAFLEEYLAAEEAQLVDGLPEPERSRLINLFWTAKESALKAIGTGLRVDTRAAVVRWRGEPGRGGFAVTLPRGPSPLRGETAVRAPWLASVVCAVGSR